MIKRKVVVLPTNIKRKVKTHSKLNHLENPTPSKFLNTPWEKDKVYIPNNSKVASGPDLAPLIEKLKKEYPTVSQTDEYKEVFKKQNPLVSIIVTTYNKGEILRDIALKSILNQTYKNIQVIVVADHSTDNTDQIMSQITDSRVIYKNMPTRPIYPGKTKRNVWLVAGTIPHNEGLKLATGDFITYCDHDDAFIPDRVEKLIQFSQVNQFDFVHHPFYIGTPSNVITRNDSAMVICGKITTSAVFHHSWFKQIPVDINCWKKQQPGDWNKFSKFLELGTRIGRYPEYLSYKG